MDDPKPIPYEVAIMQLKAKREWYLEQRKKYTCKGSSDKGDLVLLTSTSGKSNRPPAVDVFMKHNGAE
jgi:hypothetical protein